MVDLVGLAISVLKLTFYCAVTLFFITVCIETTIRRLQRAVQEVITFAIDERVRLWEKMVSVSPDRTSVH